ncbi:unnamed protein product [Thelazia callipaeda]|uniref:Zinc finger PHD-type domain-containing protein n=1 Tax=Thelazia callipaeda TaxID=103827 RepID=A0A0N5CJT1_THECL|nr:unnamed protein product [Thelazia callipaeda]
MAFTPEHGSLIVDSQYENEDQQFLEEIHLSRNNSNNLDISSINNDQENDDEFYRQDHLQSTDKAFRRSRTANAELLDYNQGSENRPTQIFGENNAFNEESSYVDNTINNQSAKYSSECEKNTNRSREIMKSTTSSQVRSEPSVEPRWTHKNIKEGNGNGNTVQVDPSTWTPPLFRKNREFFRSFTVLLQSPACNVNWLHPGVRNVLRDFKNRKISSREGAEMITKITGSTVSTTTVRVKSRILDDLDAHAEKSSVSKCNDEIGSCDGADVGSSFREKNDETLTNTASKTLVPSVDAPLSVPPKAPYYMSFSQRYKQTSLTVPVGNNEVRFYRHASHSKTGQTIHFRCSRCDSLYRTYRSGDIARIKMVDGLVITSLYPQHHSLCKPIKLVEARAREIERRCRKAIIEGMNPLEAWKMTFFFCHETTYVINDWNLLHVRKKDWKLKLSPSCWLKQKMQSDFFFTFGNFKGRKAAISEAKGAGFPVYGPNSLLSAFPEWDKVKISYGVLRSRYVRRQMQIKQRIETKKNIEKKLKIIDFDMSHSIEPKRPRIELFEDNSNDMTYERGVTAAKLVCFCRQEISGSEILSESEGNLGCDFDLDDFEEESLCDFIYNFGRPKRFTEAKPAVDRTVEESSTKPSHEPSSGSATPAEITGIERGPYKETSKEQQGISNSNYSNLENKVQENEQAVGSADVSDEQIFYQPNQASKSTQVCFSPFGLFPDPVETLQDLEELIRAKLRKDEAMDAKPGREYITFMSPAGILPCAAKNEPYTESYVIKKMRKIECAVARYNLLSNNKLAVIHMDQDGDLKMYGSKYVVQACLNSTVVRDLRKNWRNRETVEEDGIDDDELVSIPIIKCLPKEEIDMASNAHIHSKLVKFLDRMHYPWYPWFEKSCLPDYWPPSVPFFDPESDFFGLNLSPHQNFLEKSSLRTKFNLTNFYSLSLKTKVENTKKSLKVFERDVLEHGFRHYESFMEYHFGLRGPNYDEDSRNIDHVLMAGNVQQNVIVNGNSAQAEINTGDTVETESMKVRKEPSEKQNSESSVSCVSEVSNMPPDREYSNLDTEISETNLISTPVPIFSLSNEKILENHLALNRNSVLRVRYDQMEADVRTVWESIMKIQSHSTCSAMMVFMDERSRITLSGDKTLISSFLGSNIFQCLPQAKDCGFDNQVIILPLLQVFEDSFVDRMTEDQALDLLEDLMLHVNFPWNDPYDGLQPDCWPPEIPFCAPWSNNGTGILNRRIGANTPGQASKIILKSVRWFYSEMMLEKLKVTDGLEKITPCLALLTQNLLEDRGSVLQTPVPRSDSDEAVALHVPTKVLERSSSIGSGASQLRTLSRNSNATQKMMYDHLAIAPPPEEQNNFSLQDFSCTLTTPRSPSQHSITSQVTVPFILPPNHSTVVPHLTSQRHSISEKPYEIPAYESPESYRIAENDNVSTVAPTEPYIIREKAPFQSTMSSIPSHARPHDFRVPRVPQRQTVMVEDRPEWASSRSINSRSRSSKRSRAVAHESELLGSVQTTSPNQFIVAGEHYQVPVYSNSAAVSLQSNQQQQQYSVVADSAASSQNSYVALEPLQESSLEEGDSVYNSPIPCSDCSEYSSLSPERNVEVSLINVDDDDQQAISLSQDFVTQNMEQPRQEQLGFLRVLCACKPGFVLDANDCVSCSRCHKNFHSKCLQLEVTANNYYCASCFDNKPSLKRWTWFYVPVK